MTYEQNMSLKCLIVWTTYELFTASLRDDLKTPNENNSTGYLSASESVELVRAGSFS